MSLPAPQHRFRPQRGVRAPLRLASPWGLLGVRHLVSLLAGLRRRAPSARLATPARATGRVRMLRPT